LSRDKLFLGADFWLFSAVFGLVLSIAGHVFLTAFPLREQPARACTKPFLRLCHLGGMTEKLRLVLCGLETSLYPPTVLCTGMAAPLGFARELQVRERGRTRPPWLPITLSEDASAGVQATARDQGSKPRSFCAFHDAGGDGFSQDGLQADPIRVP